LILGVSGVFILAVHPRLYWGEVGNDLMPALLEFPLSNNHRPDGFQQAVSFAGVSQTAVSANRTYEIFNQNGWARSLHFLAAWFFVLAGLFYVLTGLMSGHVRRNILPRVRELAPRALWQDLKSHAARQFGPPESGPPYGLLQRVSYASVAFVALPLMVVTGLTMSPAVTAALPVLLDVFGGYQSARTIHFFCFAALALFLIVHVVMVAMTGFRRQLRGMILGK
jgi:thiosulfate reductase cytochrome b subunit